MPEKPNSETNPDEPKTGHPAFPVVWTLEMGLKILMLRKYPTLERPDAAIKDFLEAMQILEKAIKTGELQLVGGAIDPSAARPYAECKIRALDLMRTVAQASEAGEAGTPFPFSLSVPYERYNHKDVRPNWHIWLNRELWTFPEAANAVFNWEPCQAFCEELCLEVGFPSSQWTDPAFLLKMAYDATTLGYLPTVQSQNEAKVRPVVFAKWAAEKGVELPTPLHGLMREYPGTKTEGAETAQNLGQAQDEVAEGKPERGKQALDCSSGTDGVPESKLKKVAEVTVWVGKCGEEDCLYVAPGSTRSEEKAVRIMGERRLPVALCLFLAQEGEVVTAESQNGWLRLFRIF